MFTSLSFTSSCSLLTNALQNTRATAGTIATMAPRRRARTLTTTPTSTCSCTLAGAPPKKKHSWQLLTVFCQTSCKDGGYYYKNPDGSRYCNNGKGAGYYAPPWKEEWKECQKK